MIVIFFVFFSLIINKFEKTQHKVRALTSEEEEDQHHDKGVTKIQEGGDCSSDRQFGEEEMDRIQKEIHCSTAASQE